MTKILSRQTLLMVVLVGCVFYASFSAHRQQSLKNNQSSITADALLISGEGKINSPLPVRLKIPTLNIDVAIDSVGLTSDGAMGVPTGPDTVAWFDLGPRPGEIGNSVVDGHSGYKNDRPAVFDNLYKLKKGDKIYVENEKGATLTFVVREFRTYSLNDDVSNVFRSSDGASHLNLITCAGDWNAINKTHSSRLVVFTDRE